MATEPESRWSRPMTIGALQLAARHHLVEGEARAGGGRPGRPSRCAPAGPGMRCARAPCRASGADACCRAQLLHLGVGLVDVLRIARQRRPAERPDAAAEQRADIGRHEAGEVEGVVHALVLAPSGGCCCRSRASARPAAGKSSIARTCSAIDARGRALDGLADRCAPLASHSRERPALRQIAVDGSWAEVWSVTTSGRMPRRTSSGRISAALPSRPTDSGLLLFADRSISASASSRFSAATSR